MDTEVRNGLREFLENKSSDLEVRALMKRIRSSPDRQYVPLLKNIAVATSKERNRRVTFDALHTLAAMNEPRVYFVANAQDHHHNKWLAYFSILILGREPEDAEVTNALSEINAASTDNQIRGAIASAERVGFLASEYTALQSAEEKCDFLLSHFRGAWNPITLGESELDNAMNPLAVWAQYKLFELSKENPVAVARAISKVDLSDDFSSEHFTRSYQSYLAQFLTPEAAQRLSKMSHLE